MKGNIFCVMTIVRQYTNFLKIFRQSFSKWKVLMQNKKQTLRLKRDNCLDWSEMEISFTLLFGRFWDGWWDDLVNYFKLFCVFYYLKVKKSLQCCTTARKNYLSNMRQILLFFFRHQTWNNNTTLQNVHWSCSNINQNMGFGYISCFYM